MKEEGGWQAGCDNGPLDIVLESLDQGFHIRCSVAGIVVPLRNKQARERRRLGPKLKAETIPVHRDRWTVYILESPPPCVEPYPSYPINPA